MFTNVHSLNRRGNISIDVNHSCLENLESKYLKRIPTTNPIWHQFYYVQLTGDRGVILFRNIIPKYFQFLPISLDELKSMVFSNRPLPKDRHRYLPVTGCYGDTIKIILITEKLL